MYREMIERNLKELENRLRITIALDKLTDADFVLGCCYNKEKRAWEVYDNNERGCHYVQLVTESEEEAFKELYSMIEFQIETIKEVEKIKELKKGNQ